MFSLVFLRSCLNTKVSVYHILFVTSRMMGDPGVSSLLADTCWSWLGWAGFITGGSTLAVVRSRPVPAAWAKNPVSRESSALWEDLGKQADTILYHPASSSAASSLTSFMSPTSSSSLFLSLSLSLRKKITPTSRCDSSAPYSDSSYFTS